MKKRGVKAGMLTFFLSPPLSGAALGLFVEVYVLIAGVSGGSLKPKTLGEVLAFPFVVLLGLALFSLLFAMWSYWVAALPAALAAAYVSVRVGLTARMSWTETVILSVVCLAYTRGAPGFSRWVFLLDNWQMVASLIPCSLFAALTLRYLAGRRGLLR